MDIAGPRAWSLPRACETLMVFFVVGGAKKLARDV